MGDKSSLTARPSGLNFLRISRMSKPQTVNRHRVSVRNKTVTELRGIGRATEWKMRAVEQKDLDVHGEMDQPKLGECKILTQVWTASLGRGRLHAVAFPLAIERLERARCVTARSFLPILRAAVPLARSSLSITVDEKRKGLRVV